MLTVQYMWQNGGTPFSEDRSQCLLTSNECVGALQFLTDLVLKHQVSPGPTEPDAPNFRTNFRVSMEQAGRFLLPEALPGMQSGAIDPGMVVAPKGPKKDTTRGDDLAASILKSTKVLEPAWAFAKLWSAEEGQLIVLKSNRSYTARRSIARNPAILKQVLLPWESGETYFTGLNRTEVFPITPKYIPQVADIFAREERAAHAGEKTVRSWVCYFRALQIGEAAKVAALDKLSVVLVAVFAFAFLGERPGAREWLGILLITAGVLLLGYKR